jgi:eukaryotic-like serine/threonine-protein kinase
MSQAVLPFAEALTGRYRVERELGRGGMATVYLARDLRHDRQVALKVLRPGVSSVLAGERFAREIAVAARLNHPHILPLLDSGTLEQPGGDRIVYYTMPYIVGRSLGDRLRDEPQLPLEEAIRLTRQIAGALDHAHAEGVVHRDIKPENILLSGDQAIVADFGIAGALDAAGGERLTETGFVLGTPTYMSPEQGAGSREIDRRSDVYSLASVVYEMLAGEPPFTGPNPRVVIAKRLSQPVPRVTVVRETVPQHVERALLRAMAQSPAERFGTAGEFAAALAAPAPSPATRQTGARRAHLRLLAAVALGALLVALAIWLLWRSTRESTTAAVDPNVVVVIPFRVSAHDTAYNYLREGVVDLLGAQLTGDGLPRAVDTRTVLRRWSETASDGELTAPRAIALARGLGAGKLLTGEFVFTPARMSAHGRLLRVPDGRVLTQHTEAGPPGSVDEHLLLDRLLARLLALSLGEHRGRLSHLSDSTAAVRAYLAGLQKQRRGEPGAGELFARALQIDTNFALAAYWATIGGTPELRHEVQERVWAMRDRLSRRDRAQLVAELGPRYPATAPTTEVLDASERAAQLNPDRAEALERLGANLFYHGALASAPGWLPRATVALDSAIRLDSTFVLALWTRFVLASSFGTPEEVRRVGSLYLRHAASGPDRSAVRWLLADTQRDSAGLVALADETELRGWEVLISLTTLAGRSLDPLEQLGVRRFSGKAVGSEWRCSYLDGIWHISAVRGQVTRAVAFGDSMNLDPTPRCGARRAIMTMSLAEPGYGRASDRYITELARHFDTTTTDVQWLCLVEMRRVARGDTTGVRRTIARVRRMMRDRPARELGGEVCPRLLEAALEASSPKWVARPALDRLEQLMSGGIGHLAFTGNIANLLLARWFEARGDLPAALRAVRRRSQNYNWFHTMLLPAYLSAEGRLAAGVADTAGAIEAYQRFLRLRDRPDPGHQREQVNQVRAHLDEIVGAPGG